MPGREFKSITGRLICAECIVGAGRAQFVNEHLGNRPTRHRFAGDDPGFAHHRAIWRVDLRDCARARAPPDDMFRQNADEAAGANERNHQI